jgi:starch phosphorylase
MARLTPRFSANRCVREYVERCYLPAAAAYRRRARNGGSPGAALATRLRAIEEGWPTVRFGLLKTETRERVHRFAVEVCRGALDPQAIQVQLYAEPRDHEGGICIAMSRDESVSGATGMDVYRASVPAERAISDYTPRIVPADPEIAAPLESARILWQR